MFIIDTSSKHRCSIDRLSIQTKCCKMLTHMKPQCLLFGETETRGWNGYACFANIITPPLVLTAAYPQSKP